MRHNWPISLLFILYVLKEVDCFSPIVVRTGQVQVDSIRNNNRLVTTLLEATGKGSKRRRRKSPPGTPTEDPIKVAQEKIEIIGDKKQQNAIEDDYDDDDDVTELQTRKDDIAVLNEIAKFEFQTDKEISMSIKEIPVPTSFDTITATSNTEDTSIPLPDITEARKKKRLEMEQKLMEEIKEETKVKIKRSDREAFKKLLEQQPYSDADDSLFEEEEYGTVSALLGERAKPFLSIPFGPLQVGHFIGALIIVLMAFIEYPGFPLTNLPTPIRDALAGGLGTVYVINCLLAVATVFKAQERGQPIPLWVVKTIAVGGLAYDQLTQLPTTAEIERAKAVKGKRALKNKNK